MVAGVAGPQRYLAGAALAAYNLEWDSGLSPQVEAALLFLVEAVLATATTPG